MIDALGEVICFVTVSVSFIYATLLGLFCGEKFYYKRKHRIDSKILRGSYPLCLVLFCFGFVIIYSHIFKNHVTIFIATLASSLVLTQVVIFCSVTRSKIRDM